MTEVFWYNLSKEEVVEALRSDKENGLTEAKLKNRQREFGKNKLPEEKPASKSSVFLAQFKSLFAIILIIAGILTLAYHQYTDTIVIALVLLINAVIGFSQEYRASKILAELKKIVKIQARVIREGHQKIIDSEEIVPSDIIILNAGDKVPADARIIEGHDLKVDEMVLTGEFIPSLKYTEVLPENTILADRENMVYMGTVVLEGAGKAIVVGTGVNTEIGKISQMIGEKEKITPLQKKIKVLSIQIAGVVSFFCLVISILGLTKNIDIFLLFETVVAMAVGAIPEGLPVAITVMLSLGAQRILKRNGLIRNLVSVETLGSTSIILTDKTLTLTKGKMEVEEIIGDRYLALKSAVLASDVFVENSEGPKEKWIIRGDPALKAIVISASEAGLDVIEEIEKRKAVFLPFSPVAKFAAALYIEENQYFLHCLGAPEKLLELSNLKDKEKEELEKKLQKLVRKGRRVMASAYRKIDDKINDTASKELEGYCKNLVFAGFISMKDPLRKTAKEAIRISLEAGVRPIIVTGDHKFTAKAVAEELGLEVEDENILEGKELDKLSDKELNAILNKIQIFARVEPKDKIRIVQAWRNKEKVVAMIGDGVNDAPALRTADIGVALGSGTEVAKESSDLILLNDDFTVIEEAIKEGRRVLDNVKKTTLFMCAECFSEIIIVFGSFLFGLPLPILPTQILWQNLIEGSPQGLALAFEPMEEEIMKRKPEHSKTPLLTKEIKNLILFGGILTDIILLFIFFVLLRYFYYDISHLRTIVFMCLAWGSFFYLFSCKNWRKNIWEYNPFLNKYLNLTVLIGILLSLVAVYSPVFQNLLRTISLSFSEWLIIFVFGIINLVIFESVKYVSKKKRESLIEG